MSRQRVKKVDIDTLLEEEMSKTVVSAVRDVVVALESVERERENSSMNSRVLFFEHQNLVQM